MVTVRGSFVGAALAAVLLLAPLTPVPAAAAPQESAAKSAPRSEPAPAAEDWTAPLSTRGR